MIISSLMSTKARTQWTFLCTFFLLVAGSSLASPSDSTHLTQACSKACQGHATECHSQFLGKKNLDHANACSTLKGLISCLQNASDNCGSSRGIVARFDRDIQRLRSKGSCLFHRLDEREALQKEFPACLTSIQQCLIYSHSHEQAHADYCRKLAAQEKCLGCAIREFCGKADDIKCMWLGTPAPDNSDSVCVTKYGDLIRLAANSRVTGRVSFCPRPTAAQGAQSKSAAPGSSLRQDDVELGIILLLIIVPQIIVLGVRAWRPWA